MGVSSNELFSTLKNLPGLDQSSFQLAKKLLLQTDDGVDAETSLSLSLHLYLSSPPLHFILTLTFGQ